jgi:pimeloyl-ACP methyl ester carboxylesterase
MSRLIQVLWLAAVVVVSGLTATQSLAASAKPAIVLVHGAFAESSSWNGVISELEKRGFHTIAAPNPLRGPASDAASVSAVIRSVKGPVVLVAHSYGGAVITGAANGNANVKALVFVAGFMPEQGESANMLVAKFPGSLVPTSVAPVPLSGGAADIFIRPDKFRAVFAADLPPQQVALMAATQRPILAAAGDEPSGVPAWKNLPSYVIYGGADNNIPPALIAWMAERAHARKTVRLDRASHSLMISQPKRVADFIAEAASAQSLGH